MRSHRPVYILGAGFSKAINNSMPTLGDLGHDLSENNDIPYNGYPDIERWLSLHTQSLPFFKDYENAERQSHAQRTIERIANLLDRKVNSIIREECPVWLSYLVSLWAAERAIVITFNYDTLLETAINSVHPYVSVNQRDGKIKRAYSDELVYPRPIMQTNSNTKWKDFETNAPCLNSMQVLKPHGSLNWYTYGNNNEESSSIIRARELRYFNDDQTSAGTEMTPELAETQGMNRYLIPPTSNKASFYNIGLDRAIWNQCLIALQETDDITIMGYSAPETDDVVHALFDTIFKDNNCIINIVDIAAEKVKETIDNKLSTSKEIEYALFYDIPSYVEERVQTRTRQFTQELKDKLDNFDCNTTFYAVLEYPHSNHQHTTEDTTFLLDINQEGFLTIGRPMNQLLQTEQVFDVRNNKILRKEDLQNILSIETEIRIMSNSDRIFSAIELEYYKTIALLRCMQTQVDDNHIL